MDWSVFAMSATFGAMAGFAFGFMVFALRWWLKAVSVEKTMKKVGMLVPVGEGFTGKGLFKNKRNGSIVEAARLVMKSEKASFVMFRSKHDPDAMQLADEAWFYARHEEIEE